MSLPLQLLGNSKLWETQKNSMGAKSNCAPPWWGHFWNSRIDGDEPSLQGDLEGESMSEDDT